MSRDSFERLPPSNILEDGAVHSSCSSFYSTMLSRRMQARGFRAFRCSLRYLQCRLYSTCCIYSRARSAAGQRAAAVAATSGLLKQVRHHNGQNYSSRQQCSAKISYNCLSRTTARGAEVGFTHAKGSADTSAAHNCLKVCSSRQQVQQPLHLTDRPP